MTSNQSNSALFNWKSATVYFLLVDRSSTPQKLTNDIDGQSQLRKFVGGTLKGVQNKSKLATFSLGVDVLWISLIVEQIEGAEITSEGDTEAYHGYWARTGRK